MASTEDRQGVVAVFHWPDNACVALRFHHMVYDGWSVIRYYERLTKNYALLEKTPDHVFTMDRLFIDTLKSDQAYLDSSAYAEDAVFWQAASARWPETTLLSTLADRPHAEDEAQRVASVTRALPNELQDALNRLADEASVSLAECVTALTTLYLSRVSGEGDLAFGVAFLNRTRDALDIPGQFAKALPLGLSLDPRWVGTVGEGIARIAEAFRDVLKHGRYPFGEIVRRLGLDARHTEVSVNTLFLKRGVELEGEPSHIQWLSGPEGGLSFLYTQFGRQASMDLELRFNRALFDDATIARHADRLLHFLAQVSADLHARVADVALLLDDERTLLLDTWNATEHTFAEDACIHQRVEAQALHHPDAPALVAGDDAVSYAELNTRANRLAHQLVVGRIAGQSCGSVRGTRRGPGGGLAGGAEGRWRLRAARPDLRERTIGPGVGRRAAGAAAGRCGRP